MINRLLNCFIVDQFNPIANLQYDNQRDEQN